MANLTRFWPKNKLTYALFNQLAEHFNGDMFPCNKQEEDAITQDHLDLLKGFLLGDVDPNQPKLFLWAYDFKIIPIELISSIYEGFYHQSDNKDKGTHYTPSVLVEYVLSHVLTPERLATKPKVLDFACGSAIFLVQAFQRIEVK
jgi:type I restriction-modification system DNA methylase subunit